MEILSIIDHTILKAFATEKDIELLCEQAREYKFASVCVNPHYVSLASSLLKESDVKVCTVVGFPLGANTVETKVFETIDAVKNGADEIDMVINIGKAKAGDFDYLQDEIRAVVDAAKDTKAGTFVKVIMETCYLTDFAKIKICEIAKEYEADAVKTSTGFGDGGATVEDVTMMRETVGPIMCVKASGGIKNLEDAKKMIEAGATRLGTSAGVTIAKEIKGN
jgi:deoxyribose-phosphate aldolase